jgi:aryl-alcohol dehydrogenase-like predicted oxidoreductase
MEMRILGTTGVRVSPLCLGAMMFGSWGNPDPRLADEAGLSMIHLALAFVTSHPAITSAIVGPRTMEHLDSQLGAADVVLTSEILDKIDEIVPPGTTLNPPDRGYEPPALTDPALRRRH